MTKILIIEDESRIASFVSRGLEAAGYETQTVEDGGEGLAAALHGDQGMAGVGQHGPAGGGQFDTVSGPGEEDGAQVLLERLDLPGYGGLSQVERFSGFGKTASVSDGAKGLQ